MCKWSPFCRRDLPLSARLKISVVREISHRGVVDPEKVAAIEKEVQIIIL